MQNFIKAAKALVLVLASFGALAAQAQAQSSETPTVVVSSDHSSIINAIVYSPDGRWLASASSDSSIKIWEADSGRLLRTLNGHIGDASALAISLDGKLMASASGLNDRRAIIWNPVNGEVVATIADIAPGQDNQPQQGIAFFRDGQSIFTLSYTSINRWDIQTGKLTQAITRQQKQYGFNIWQKFAVSRDSRHIAAADSNQLFLLDAASGRTISSLGTHPQKKSNYGAYPEVPGTIVFLPGWGISRNSLRRDSQSL